MSNPRKYIFNVKICRFIIGLVACGVMTAPAHALSIVQANDTQTCANKQYRKQNPTKCMFFTGVAPAIGGLSAIGGALALLGMSGGGGGGGSASAPTQPTMTSTNYNMVGNDVDAARLSGIISNSDYTMNRAQYDDIRLAYSLARGFTGRGTTIAVLDSGSDYWHSAAVSSIAGGTIAPNAVVESYQVTTSGKNFMSYDKIGDVIASAPNANVYNASWNAPMQATQIHTRAELIQHTDENFVNQVSIAATKRDAIFVFAAGNDGNAQSGALSAMPRVMKELNGHFINVVAYDSDAGEIAWYSNACGVTQDYCITAPGSDIDTGNKIVNGTSFAAPIVSAAVAVLREAYPYMTATQITSLLFETARDIGAPGVDPVYGHGMLDMERATRPVGAALVPIGDTMQPVRTAHVAAPIARNIKSAGVKFAFFDAYGRPFQANLSDNIKSYNPGRGFDFLRATNRDKKMEFGPIEMGFAPKDFVIGDGMLKLKQDSASGFIGTRGNLQQGEFNFSGNARLSMLRPHTVDESMISDITTVYMASVEASAQYRDFTFGIAMPDVIVRGDMQITTPIGRDRWGQILYTQNSVSLATRPVLQYTASYKYLTAGFVDNPYGTDEIFIVAKTRFKF